MTRKIVTAFIPKENLFMESALSALILLGVMATMSMLTTSHVCNSIVMEKQLKKYAQKNFKSDTRPARAELKRFYALSYLQKSEWVTYAFMMSFLVTIYGISLT
jgi:hypothetical protein